MSSLFGTMVVDAEKYPNVNDAKKTLYNELSDILESEIYHHNHRGAYEAAADIINANHILYNDVFDDYDKAESFLNLRMSHSRLVVCKYMKPMGMNPKYMEQADRLRQEMKGYEEKHAIRNYSSTLKKHCPNCWSDINVKFFKTDKCPLCGYDLQSATVKKTLARYKERIEKAEEQYKNSSKNTVPYWMFVFEALAG